MLVIADSSALIALSICNCLDLYLRQYIFRLGMPLNLREVLGVQNVFLA